MMVEVNALEEREHWTLMKRKEVSKEHYLNVQLSTILDIWLFKRKIFTNERLLNYKSRLCAHVGMQKWGINY